LRAGIRLAVLLLLVAPPLRGQTFLEQFSYEGLRFSGIAFEFGGILSNSVTTEPIGGVRVDLGVVAPQIRVVMGGSYFKGDVKPDRIAEFEQRLGEVLIDCACDSISVGAISQSNVELYMALQYLVPVRGRVRPYAGVGFSAHVRDGDGAVIDGTFVEDALDTVAAGVDGAVGVDVLITPRIAVLAEIRGVLTSELQSASARGGLLIRFP
jgi:hypothetical protein